MKPNTKYLHYDNWKNSALYMYMVMAFPTPEGSVPQKTEYRKYLFTLYDTGFLDKINYAVSESELFRDLSHNEHIKVFNKWRTNE